MLDGYAFFIGVGVFLLILIFRKIIFLPLKVLIKFLFRCLVGALILYVINEIGNSWCFHLGINWYTIAISGILGVPGICLMVVLNLII